MSESRHYSPVKCSTPHPLLSVTILFEDNVSTPTSFGMQNEDLKMSNAHVMFIYLNTDITKVILPSPVIYLTSSSLVIYPHLFSSKAFKEKKIIKPSGFNHIESRISSSFQQLGTWIFSYKPQMHVEEHLLEWAGSWNHWIRKVKLLFAKQLYYSERIQCEY